MRTKTFHLLQTLIATAVLFAAMWITITTLSSCSPSALAGQRTAAAITSRSGNAFLDGVFGAEGNDKISSLYAQAQIRVVLIACGHDPDDFDPKAVYECERYDEAIAARQVIRDRWAAVMHVWSLARVAHTAWRVQLDKCEAIKTDAGDDCGLKLDLLAATVLQHVTAVRCSIKGLGADDPFPGPVTCPGDSKDGGQ